MKTVVLLRATNDPELEHGVRESTMCLDEPSGDALAVGLGHLAAAGGELAGIAVGPPEWEPALRDAIALGVAGVVRLWGPAIEEGGLVAAASAIAGELRGIADIVIAGGPAPDHGSGILPFALAEFLDWAVIEDVVETGVEGGRTVARVRRSGGRRQTLGLPPGTVLVAARGHVLPYPAVARKLAARRATIPEHPPAGGPAGPQWQIEGYGPAMPVTRHLLRPSATANAGGRLRQLMAGGATRQGKQAPAAEGGGGMASQLADILAKQGLLD